MVSFDVLKITVILLKFKFVSTMILCSLHLKLESSNNLGILNKVVYLHVKIKICRNRRF